MKVSDKDRYIKVDARGNHWCEDMIRHACDPTTKNLHYWIHKNKHKQRGKRACQIHLTIHPNSRYLRFLPKHSAIPEYCSEMAKPSLQEGNSVRSFSVVDVSAGDVYQRERWSYVLWSCYLLLPGKIDA